MGWMTLWTLAVFGIGCGEETVGIDEGSDGDSNGSDSNVRSEVRRVGDIERDGNFVLELSDNVDTVLFECTAERGGLITKFALNGENILAEEESVSSQNGFGSTFWVAPQTVWDWPPLDALNTDAATSAVDADTGTITLTTSADTEFNFQVVKKFSPDLEHFAVALEYTIVNTGEEPIQFAPWEISRVLPGGITFFPTGSEVDEVVGMKPLTIVDEEGVSWFDHREALTNGDYKYIADGSGGYLAHATQTMLFVKSFEDQPASVKPPGQGEIQLYVKGGMYQEVEQMGAYEEIPVGGEASWKVRWTLQKLPSDAAFDVGAGALVDLAEDLAQ